MGFCISWVAIWGKDPEVVLDVLGWRRTGVHEELPESPTTCTTLGSGWFLIAMMNRADAYDGTLGLAALSKEAEVVASFVEEHVMFSGSVLWRNGQKIWSVEHDAQEGVHHLVVSGEVPPEMSLIIDEARSSQDAEDRGDAEVDFIFDVPVDMSQLLTGFRYDRNQEDGVELTFEVLAEVPRGRPPGWLKSLFGRGAG
jgi:hypothetical protein